MNVKIIVIVKKIINEIVMCSINEKTNTKGTNITSTAFINCHNENVRD